MIFLPSNVARRVRKLRRQTHSYVRELFVLSLLWWWLLVWDARCKLTFDRIFKQICRYHNHPRSDAIYERLHRTAWEPPSRAFVMDSIVCLLCNFRNYKLSVGCEWPHTRLDFTPPEHCAILRDLKFFFPSTRDAERPWPRARGSKYGPKTNFGTHLRLTNRGRNLLRC